MEGETMTKTNWSVEIAIARLSAQLEHELDQCNKYGHGNADYLAVGAWLKERAEQWNVRKEAVTSGTVVAHETHEL
jgi:hypothetical protein